MRSLPCYGCRRSNGSVHFPAHHRRRRRHRPRGAAAARSRPSARTFIANVGKGISHVGGITPICVSNWEKNRIETGPTIRRCVENIERRGCVDKKKYRVIPEEKPHESRKDINRVVVMAFVKIYRKTHQLVRPQTDLLLIL